MAKPKIEVKPTSKMYSFDVGNGTCKGISSERTEPIAFAPLVAPMTDRRALTSEDARPTYNLRIDDSVLVFGVDDVYAHGRRVAARRLNAKERYSSADYFCLIDVLYLQAFAAQRGGTKVAPVGAISLPVSEYNDQAIVDGIREQLIGRRMINDLDRCPLELEITQESLIIIPESVGAMTHYGFDPVSLGRRGETKGSTLVIDVGYETTDVSLFEGMKYQRDQSFTIARAGLGIVARSIADGVRATVRDADPSRIDASMRQLAGTRVGGAKYIEIAPGVVADVASVYDAEIANLANRVAQEVLTQFSGTVTRVLLAGGGAMHLGRYLDDLLPWAPVPAPDPDLANVRGGMTLVKLKAARA